MCDDDARDCCWLGVVRPLVDVDVPHHTRKESPGVICETFRETIV